MMVGYTHRVVGVYHRLTGRRTGVGTGVGYICCLISAKPVSIGRGGRMDRGLGVHFGLHECWPCWVVERGSMVAREQVVCRLAGVTRTSVHCRCGVGLSQLTERLCEDVGFCA